MPVTATLIVDLSRDRTGDLARADRRALANLDLLPDGARVVLEVGFRRDVTTSALHALADHRNRLFVDIHSPSAAVAHVWHRAIVTGEVLG